MTKANGETPPAAGATAHKEPQVVRPPAPIDPDPDLSDSDLDRYFSDLTQHQLERLFALQPPFEIERPLPLALVKLRNGDFLSKAKYDLTLQDESCDEERNSGRQVVLMLNTQGNYLQPSVFRWSCKKQGANDATIDGLFEQAGIPPAQAGENYPIEHQTIIRCPKDPDRFVEAGKLRREQPDAMVMARDIFFQNGWIGRDFSPNLRGNFSNLVRLINARKYKRSFLLAQSELLDEMKRATAKAMADPRFAWPSSMTEEERSNLARQSWLGTLEISDSLVTRIGLRLTFPGRSREPSPELSPSETSEDELPYEIPTAIGNSTRATGNKRPPEDRKDVAVSKRIRRDRSTLGL